MTAPLGPDFPALLAAAADGSGRAFEAIYRSLSPAVLRYLRAREPVEGDDLAAEVWADVANQLGNYAGDEDGFRALTFTIARRRLSDHRRRRRRRRTDVVSPDTLSDRAAGQQPEALVMDNLGAQEAVDRLVRPLPDAQAEVVLLRVVGGLSVDEVARLLHRSPGSVRILQHRALKRLAEWPTLRAVSE